MNFHKNPVSTHGFEVTSSTTFSRIGVSMDMGHAALNFTLLLILQAVGSVSMAVVIFFP